MLPAGAPTNAIAFSYGYVKVRDMVSLFGPPRKMTFHASCDQARLKLQSELTRPISCNQASDVHRGSTLITWRWRHRNHDNTIASVIAVKQTVTTFHNKIAINEV